MIINVFSYTQNLRGTITNRTFFSKSRADSEYKFYKSLYNDDIVITLSKNSISGQRAIFLDPVIKRIQEFSNGKNNWRIDLTLTKSGSSWILNPGNIKFGDRTVEFVLTGKDSIESRFIGEYATISSFGETKDVQDKIFEQVKLGSRKKVLLCTFGLGGHSLQFGGGSLSGYDDPERFIKEVNEGKYDEYKLEGVYVRDGRTAFEKDSMLAIKEPLVGKEFSKAPTVDPLMTPVAANFGIAGLELLRNNLREVPVSPDNLDSLGGLDQVDPETYISWWRKFGVPKGAKIGKINYVGNVASIEWEN